MSITLPELPFALDALEPHMSKATLEFHHGKHHKGYVDKTQKAIAGTALENAPLEDIIRKTAADKSKQSLFNNAAQVWNHTLFWNSLSPAGGGKPEGRLAEAIQRDFGGLSGFRDAFTEAATGQFGSGWAWLVAKDGKLEITCTPNALNPLVTGGTALLTCDVWEHAYYLDYQNRRDAFVQTFLDHLVDWSAAESRLSTAKAA